MKKLARSLVIALSFLSVTAYATKPADWWVDISNDRIEQVRSHLAMGEDPNAISPSGQPSLMLAIQKGAWHVYDFLVRHRQIDVNITNSTDETPLMYLAVLGQTARAAQLIDKGAQVNRLGWTPLHYAASKAHEDTVKLLLSHKAIVNAPSPDGTSPLMMAAYAGSDEVVRILLAAGADVTARNLQGEDAADWARKRHHNRLADQLDDLTQKVLKRRGVSSGDAQTASPRVGEHTATRDGSSRSLDTLTPPDPSKPSEPKASTSGSRQSAGSQDGGSTSRYFDLDRFEHEEDRF